MRDGDERRALLAAVDLFEIEQQANAPRMAPLLVALLALMSSGAATGVALGDAPAAPLSLVAISVGFTLVAVLFVLGEALHQSYDEIRRAGREAAAREVRRIIEAERLSQQDAGAGQQRRWWQLRMNG